MNCSLEKKLKKEHENMRTPALGEMTFTCPVIGKQICFWCCLHISGIADPLTRTRSAEVSPGYEREVSEIARRDWDSIWETCSKCHSRSR